jgi:hypothetical protein
MSSEYRQRQMDPSSHAAAALQLLPEPQGLGSVPI